MKSGIKIAFFGSSLVSAYWNGAATYYRGMIKQLAKRGHHVTFYEPDAYDRQKNRDIDDPEWAEVVVFSSESEAGVYNALQSASSADVIVKASGVGVFDQLLEEQVLEAVGPHSLAVFWDVDAPATLDRVNADLSDGFHKCIPKYDLILTYGGGFPVVDAYLALGAHSCHPIYNALDPETHYPVPADPRYSAALCLLANRLPDREERVDEFFLRPAAHMPNKSFILGGSGWDTRNLPANVDFCGHVSTNLHNVFNCSSTAILNVSRESMARYGFSPATRVFEAAGAGACIITDRWEGVECFFEPDTEILIASSGADVERIVAELTPARARTIGDAALLRALRDHTYAGRAVQVEQLLTHKLEEKCR